MMINCFEVPTVSFCLADYCEVIKSKENEIINDLHKYDLLKDLNFRKIDTKKVLYHHIIYGVCEAVCSIKTQNRIVVYNNLQYINTELLQYTSKYKLIKFLETLTRKIKTMLPIKIYDGDEDYDTFVDKCKTDRGELKTRAILINNFIKKKSNQQFDFEAVKNFVEKYELTYLSKHYFNNIKVKNLVFL